MLLSKEPLIFVSERRGESKQGNPYQFIKLANPKTFENYEMFAAGVSVSGFAKGDLVNVEVDLSAGYGKTNVNVVSLTPAS